MVSESKALTDYGTSLAVEVFDEIGDLPIKNWYDRRFKGAGKISGQAMSEKILVKKYACGQCIVRCGRIEYDEIRFFPCLEVANAIIQVQCLGRTERRQVQGSHRRQCLVPQVQGLVCIAHCAQHRETRTSSDVRGQACSDSCGAH